MSILKNTSLALGILAIVGTGSIALISANAQGRMFDSNAASFIQSGDLAGYKNYLIGQETTRINAIDQAKFDKIKVEYTAQKPLLDLQAKYEPLLLPFVTNKDQAGFVSKYKEFQTEAKPLMEAQRTARQAKEASNPNRAIKSNNMMNKTAPTDQQLTDMATSVYNKAVTDTADGKTFKLGFGGSKGHGGKKGGYGMRVNGNDDSKNSNTNTNVNTSK
jgi:hypothetical protein